CNFGTVTDICRIDNTADKGAVNLQSVKRKAMEIAQRGVTSTKVVDRQTDAYCFHLLQHLNRCLGISHDRALSQLQPQSARREADFWQQLLDVLNQSWFHELLR